MPHRAAIVTFRAACAAVLVGAAAPAPAVEPARPAGKIEALYAISWMGFTVYSAHLAADWQDGRYRLRFRAEAQGLVRLAANNTIQWETRGRIVRGKLQPEGFDQVNTFRRLTRRIAIEFAAETTAIPKVSVVPPESPGKRPPVPDALKAGTLDPLTATFAAVTVPLSARTCGYEAKVFEGLRRTDVRLEHEGAERAPVIGAGLEREALVCLLHAKRLAGYEDKHFRQHPEPLPPAKLWVAKHPGIGLWLPVQLRFESSYGPVYARLVRLDVGK